MSLLVFYRTFRGPVKHGPNVQSEFARLATPSGRCIYYSDILGFPFRENLFTSSIKHAIKKVAMGKKGENMH